MKIRVQLCRVNRDRYPSGLAFRLLIAGGIIIPTNDGKWNRKTATAALDKLEAECFDRKKIRFVHV